MSPLLGRLTASSSPIDLMMYNLLDPVAEGKIKREIVIQRTFEQHRPSLYTHIYASFEFRMKMYSAFCKILLNASGKESTFSKVQIEGYSCRKAKHRHI